MNISLAWKSYTSLSGIQSKASLSRVTVWDGWRGMAIILLLTGHFFNRIWIWEDRLGVDAFFVLSGMLMSTILFEKRTNLKVFYIRRFSRIFPAFSLYVIVVFLLSMILGMLSPEKGNYSFDGIEVVSTLTFFRTYYPLDPHIWSTDVPIAHLWSLNVEEHAYVIMSLLTLFIFRNTKAAYALITLGLISIGICFYYYGSEDAPIQFRLRTESAVSFVFLSAGYNLLRKKFNITVPSILPVITLIAAFLCYLEDPVVGGQLLWVPWLSFSLAPILLAFTLNHLTEAHGLLSGILELKFMRLMGAWSFSIYLWQQVFYQYKYVVPGGASVAVILAVLTGIFSFYFIENPSRNWINGRWTRNK